MSEKANKIKCLHGDGLREKCRDGTLKTDFNTRKRFPSVNKASVDKDDGAALQTALRLYPLMPMNGFVKLPVLVALAAMSDVTLWKKVAAGELAAPVKLGKRAVAWRKADVEDFLNRDRPLAAMGISPIQRKEGENHVS